MSGVIPAATSQWVIESNTGISGLKLKHDVPLPSLGAHDILVKVHAVALNSRDHQILNVNSSLFLVPVLR